MVLSSTDNIKAKQRKKFQAPTSVILMFIMVSVLTWTEVVHNPVLVNVKFYNPKTCKILSKTGKFLKNAQSEIKCVCWQNFWQK